MWKPKLEDKVIIEPTGVKGKIIGIWHSRGETLYNIQYATSTKAICQDWLYICDITPAEENTDNEQPKEETGKTE